MFLFVNLSINISPLGSFSCDTSDIQNDIFEEMSPQNLDFK